LSELKFRKKGFLTANAKDAICEISAVTIGEASTVWSSGRLRKE
jgi:hypothetical protein